MWFLSTKTARGTRVGPRLATSPWNHLSPTLLVLLLSVTTATVRSRTSRSEDRTGLVVGADALGLQCPPCERVHCSPRRPSRLRCRGGVVRGVCNCCPVCAKLEGEPCGGQWNYLGRCDAGLYCDAGGLPGQSVGLDAGSKAARSSQDYKERGLNSLLKTEGYCRKGRRIDFPFRACLPG